MTGRKAAKIVGALVALGVVGAVVAYFGLIRDFEVKEDALREQARWADVEATAVTDAGPSEEQAEQARAYDDNGVWLRRHWLHGGADLDASQLVEALDELGIRRVYPFLGPMDEDGQPGWREGGTINHYEPDKARRFLSKMQRIAPHIAVMPWSGGQLERDVRLTDEAQRKAYAGHIAKIVELGADGIHINVEPLPSGEPGYLDLLREVKEAIGDDKTLSIAAYPPTTPLHPHPEVHWTLEFTKEVCAASDELVVMGYDTALTDPKAYEGLMAKWTKDLLGRLPSPKDGGCEVLIGVPAYEDDEPYRRPSVENIEHGLEGVKQGLAGLDEVPAHFRGVAVYASWTTDAQEWDTYQRLWRDKESVGVTIPDFQLFADVK